MSGQVQRRNAQLVELLRSEYPRSPWGCAFLAYNSAGDANQTGAGGAAANVDFNTEVYDLGNDFTQQILPLPDFFTAPATGVYCLATTVYLYNLAAAHNSGRLDIVTSNRTYFCANENVGAMREVGNTLAMWGYTHADMDAGDTAYVTVVVSGGAAVVGINGNAGVVLTRFSGQRVS